MTATHLAKCIAQPQRIARILEWNRNSAVMALSIGKDCIGLALTTHPSNNKSVFTLDPIHFSGNNSSKSRPKTSELVEHVAFEIERLITENKVCAVVVGWPMQSNGRLGKPCGKVLHFLDYFAGRSHPLLTKDRPFALWDESEIDPSTLTDKWGRSELYSRVPKADLMVYNSRDHQDPDSSKDPAKASHVLKGFMSALFGEEYDEDPHYVDNPEISYCSDLTNLIDERFLVEYESNSSYMKPNLL